jgi:hypothetical protein
MLMATAIDKQVPQTPGKAALAMEAFSRALRQLPTIIAGKTPEPGTPDRLTNIADLTFSYLSLSLSLSLSLFVSLSLSLSHSLTLSKTCR